MVLGWLYQFVQCRWLLRRLREVIFLISTRKSQFSTSLLNIWKLFLLRLREGWEVIVRTLLFNLDVWAHMVQFCCYNYILYILYKWCNIIIWKYFFYGKKVFTAGSCLQLAVLMSPSPTVPDTNRQWWVHITNGCKTSGDGLAITNDLNPTVPKTVGDVLLELAVIGVAVVVS